MTTPPLLTQGMLRGARRFAERGLQTDVSVYRETMVLLGTTPGGSDDLGDDSLSAKTTRESSYPRILRGWFFSTPTPLQVEESGALVTVNTYRLFLPVGTDILPGDRISMGGEEYTVSDTTGESTWQAVLVCSLRKRD